jgi:peptidoglycan hydrolase CwlO-like protein
MKKTVLTAAALILALSFLTACVSQGEYDRLSAELQASRADYQSLQDELNEARTKIQTSQDMIADAQNQIQSLQLDLTDAADKAQSLEAELAEKAAELDSAQSRNDSLQGENDVLEGRLEQGRARVEVMNDILLPSLTGELDYMTENEAMSYFLMWRDKIIAIGDPELTAKFQAILDTMTDRSLSEFFIYLLESIPRELGYTSVPSSST